MARPTVGQHPLVAHAPEHQDAIGGHARRLRRLEGQVPGLGPGDDEPAFPLADLTLELRGRRGVGRGAPDTPGRYYAVEDGGQENLPGGDPDHDILTGALGTDPEVVAEEVGDLTGVLAGLGFGDAVRGIGGFCMQDGGLLAAGEGRI